MLSGAIVPMVMLSVALLTGVLGWSMAGSIKGWFTKESFKLAAACGVVGFFLSIPYANYRFYHYLYKGTVTVCTSNLKATVTALEMYSVDFDGHYPQSLKQLTPDYLSELPACPYQQHHELGVSNFHERSEPIPFAYESTERGFVLSCDSLVLGSEDGEPRVVETGFLNWMATTKRN